MRCFNCLDCIDFGKIMLLGRFRFYSSNRLCIFFHSWPGARPGGHLGASVYGFLYLFNLLTRWRPIDRAMRCRWAKNEGQILSTNSGQRSWSKAWSPAQSRNHLPIKCWKSTSWSRFSDFLVGNVFEGLMGSSLDLILSRFTVTMGAFSNKEK